MQLTVSNIKINVNYTEKQLLSKLANACRKKPEEIVSYKILKRSVDARDKNNVCFVFTLDVEIRGEKESIRGANGQIGEAAGKNRKNASLFASEKTASEKRVVVIGSGPAGLFAALTLAEAGIPPLLIERGGDVDSRKSAVDLFRKTGLLDTNSNVQFGEGGAGTFSDGKLHTGINDKRIRYVLERFHEAGAPEEILWMAKPHIGTDKLRSTVKGIRKKLISLGTEVMFNTCVTDIVTDCGKLCGLVLKMPDGEVKQIECDKAIFAIGHSSRDTVKMLYDRGVEMEKKPFAVGVRIEHPRKMIDESQYGKFAGNERLGAADYKLSCKTSTGHGVYSFCMCPGGVVVAAASEENGLVVNGMSEFARDAENSNCALLVGISPEDTAHESVLSGIDFQRKIEKLAYELGGGSYKAPVQLYGDLRSGKASAAIGDVTPSYIPGVTPCDLRDCMPRFVTDSIAEAISVFGRQIKGFDRYDAVLTGVESRSSSPVRLLRKEDMQASIKGIYPCGEGAGYAGGITSAAVDGIKCAEKIIKQIFGAVN